MSEHSHHHSIRRIVLPSGRSIEVVRFEQTDAAPYTARELHVCPECESALVQPVDWAEAPSGAWELVLWCPNCDWSVEGLYSEEEVNALEEQLDFGLEDMLRDLQRLTHANMTDHCERFAAALHADLILPEDF